MKKQIGLVIVAGVVLTVLISALIFLLALPDNEDESETSSTAATLIDYASTDIEKIEVENSGGTYTLMTYSVTTESTVESSGETSTVTTTDVFYTMQEHSSYTVDSDKADSLAYDCANLTASKTVNTGNNPDSDYGLDEPRATVTVGFSDGVEKTVMVGDEAPGGESAYVKMGGSDKIYVVALDSVSSMLVEKLQMLDKTLINSLGDDETLDSLSVTGEGRETAFTLNRNSFSNTSEYYLSSPVAAVCDGDETESFLETSVFPFEANSVAAIDVEENDLSKYGLDNPYYTIEAATSEKSYKLLVSKPDDDKNSYIMLEGDKIVYQVESSTIDFIDSDGSDILSDTVINPNMSKLNTAVISYGDSKDEYTLSHTESENNKGSTVTSTTVALGETSIQASLFSTFMMNLSILSRSEKTPEYDSEADPLLSVAVTYTDDSTDTLLIYKGEKKAVVVLNGTAVGTVELEKAEQLLSCAESLATNTEFDSLIEEEDSDESSAESSESSEN